MEQGCRACGASSSRVFGRWVFKALGLSGLWGFSAPRMQEIGFSAFRIQASQGLLTTFRSLPVGFGLQGATGVRRSLRTSL